MMSRDSCLTNHTFHTCSEYFVHLDERNLPGDNNGTAVIFDALVVYEGELRVLKG